MRKKSNRKRTIWTSVITVVGVALLVIGGLGMYDYIHRTQTGPTIPDSAQTVLTADDASEKKPVVTNDYTVPKNQPRLIKIAGANVDAYIQRVGVTKQGAMATPNNIYFTGWYTGSVVPGEKGVSIINGHVGGRYNPGVFVDLKSLKTDDDINIQMGDLSWRNFKVVSVNSYSLSDTGKALFQDDPTIDNELHLITCDGTFDSSSQSYDRREVVVARYDGTQ